jgi:hypothetical protein
MPMDVVHNGELGDQRFGGIDVGRWPISLLLRREPVLVLVRELVTTIRDSIRFRSPGIRMSPMSDTWLKAHECEYDKHGTEP